MRQYSGHKRTAMRQAIAVGSASLLVAATAGTALAAPAENEDVSSSSPSSVSSSQAAAMADLGVTASPDGWLLYESVLDPSIKLSQKSIQTFSGTKNADGSCTSTGSTSSSTTQAQYAEQIAFNPTSCASRYLIGVLPAGVDPLKTDNPTTTAAAARSAPTVQASAKASGAAGTATSAAAAAAVSYASAHTKTAWVDPVNLAITGQVANLKWPLYGAAGTLSSSTPWYEFKYDGWTLDYARSSGFVGLSDGSGWRVTGSSHHINRDFATLVYVVAGGAGWAACGAHTTNRADFYHSDTITGLRNNTFQNSWNDTKSGACSNLVHTAASNGSGFAS